MPINSKNDLFFSLCQVHVWIVLYWPHLPPCLHQTGQDDHAGQHWPGGSLWLGGSHIFVVTGAMLTLELRTCGQSFLNLRVLKIPSWPLVLTSPRTTLIRWSIPLEEEIPIAPSLQLDEYRRKWPSSKVGQPGRLGIHRVMDDIGLLKVLPTFFSNWSSHSTISFKIQVAGVEHRCGALPSWTDEREFALQLLPSPWRSRSSHGTVTISFSHCQPMLSVVLYRPGKLFSSDIT